MRLDLDLDKECNTKFLMVNLASDRRVDHFPRLHSDVATPLHIQM